MFDRLSEGFTAALRRIGGRGSITASNISEAVEEVRTALLEADVHHDVVQSFCEDVVREAQGEKVAKSLKPGEAFIGLVHDRLVQLIGGDDADSAATGVERASPGPTVVMMCGLQGSGKTTTCAKLAGYLKKRGRSTMLAAADLQRPAAVEQLQIVAEQVEQELPGGASVQFYGEPDKVAAYGKASGVAVDVCKRALKEARKRGVDTLILDTAGRLHVDDALMGELRRIKDAVGPHQTFLVVDAMTGQDAVTSAGAFHDRLTIDGVILTKFDSDARGGAALSIRHVTGAPIRFIGVGEKLDQIEEFHAERAAGRILGMGDVVSLVEKAQEQVSEEEAERLQEKMMRGEMTMDDFLSQLRSLRRMGPMKQILGMLPGVGQAIKDVAIDDKHFDHIEGIINSMTKQERRDVSILNHSRRRRIAQGSSTSTNDVSRMVKQFQALSKLTKQMAGLGPVGKVKAMRQLQGAGQGAGAPLSTRGSTRTRAGRSGYKRRKRR